MITLTTHTIYEYLKAKFPRHEQILKNGTIDKSTDKSISVLLGPDTRNEQNLAIGGIECTVTRMLPVNIHVRWGTNQREHDTVAVEIYNALLLEGYNFLIDNVKIAFIHHLDSCPQSIGRDDKNVCESVIRINVHYYV